jgi:hypothetical protein
MRLGGRGGEEKISHPLPGLEPPTIQLVAQRYTTKLSQLLGPRIFLSILLSNIFNLFSSYTVRHDGLQLCKVKGKFVTVLLLTEHHSMKACWGLEV